MSYENDANASLIKGMLTNSDSVRNDTNFDEGYAI